MEYVKEIAGRFKNNKREKCLKNIADFSNDNLEKVKGLTGFVLMANQQDPYGATNSIVWETKEDMDSYYSNDKTHLAVVERIKLMMDDELVMLEFKIFTTKMKPSD